MSELPLVIENLSFRYRDRQGAAIHDISFETRAGEVLLIAGATGCGKTTLIRCINGLIPRSYKGEINGRVMVLWEEVKDLPLYKVSQKVGTVLQDPERQILGTRVLNEVAFGLENLNVPRGEIYQRVDEVLRFLNISHLRDRETFSLSGGEKQKVALAGILAMRPSFLLLDEPLASLDPASAQDTLSIPYTESQRHLVEPRGTVPDLPAPGLEDYRKYSGDCVVGKICRSPEHRVPIAATTIRS